MTGIEIMPHAFPSVYMIILFISCKLIAVFVQLAYSVVNISDHLLPFLRGTVILFIPINGNA